MYWLPHTCIGTDTHTFICINFLSHAFSGNMCAPFRQFSDAISFTLHNNLYTPIYPAARATPSLDNKIFLTAHSLAYSHDLAVQMSALAFFCGCFRSCMTSFSAKGNNAHAYKHTYTYLHIYRN